jgi:hypothetical protein
MPNVLMACGCRANAVLPGTSSPACAIHDCFTVLSDRPNLFGRIAKCTYYPRGGKYGKCQEPQPSDLTLPFFEYRPNGEEDRYYCGCWGWD